MLYAVDIFLVHAGSEERMSHHFESDSDESAIRDAHRWAKNRCDAMQQLYGTEHMLGCVKLYHFHPQRIQPDGYLPPTTGLWVYEWKYDHPGAAQLHATLSKPQ